MTSSSSFYQDASYAYHSKATGCSTFKVQLTEAVSGFHLSSFTGSCHSSSCGLRFLPVYLRLDFSHSGCELSRLATTWTTPEFNRTHTISMDVRARTAPPPPDHILIVRGLISQCLETPVLFGMKWVLLRPCHGPGPGSARCRG
jgi:hypothetical protein